MLHTGNHFTHNYCTIKKKAINENVAK